VNSDIVGTGGGTWRQDAGCGRIDDPDIFFPARSDSPAPALAICASCTVTRQCGGHALAVPEPYGVWGGFTEQDRRALLASGGGRGSPRISPSSWVGLGSRRIGA
jgi:hypothetical protein